MKGIASILALAVLGLAGGAAAQNAPSAPPKPDPALAQLDYFVGSWTCKGKADASPWGPEHATTAKVRITRELGGFFVTGRYDEDGKGNPMPVHFAWTWGYDAKDKQFDAWGFDSFGGASKQESKGWEGDKLVWSGNVLMGGQTSGARDTFTRKSDHEVVHTGEMQLDGKWTRMGEEACTKASAAKKK